MNSLKINGCNVDETFFKCTHCSKDNDCDIPIQNRSRFYPQIDKNDKLLTNPNLDASKIKQFTTFDDPHVCIT